MNSRPSWARLAQRDFKSIGTGKMADFFNEGRSSVNQTEYSLRTIELKLDRLIDWVATQDVNPNEKTKTEDVLEKRYVTLDEACAMLNVYKLSTLRARKDLQPSNPIRIGRKRCFTRESVELWLQEYKSKEMK